VAILDVLIDGIEVDLSPGMTSGRFAISPSASLTVRGDRGFFVARDTVSLLDATGGRFGINDETTIGAMMSTRAMARRIVAKESMK
jgi:hypothetical protein